MLYYFSQAIMDAAAGSDWESAVGFLRLFRYITFRAAGALLTALLLSWWLGPYFIAWLKELKFGQDYADKAEEGGDLKTRLLSKKGTPTMGGVMIVLILDLSALLWTQWNTQVQLTMLLVLVLAGLGFYDDYAKITKQNNKGAKSHTKLWVQTALAGFVAIYLWQMPSMSKLVADVMVPFYKYPVLTGTAGLVGGILVTMLTIVGSSNAVNLTDGLDGLAIGCTIIVSVVFLILTYIAGNVRMAEYLQVPFVAGSGELAVFCAAMVGAGLGFLWYNCHPAKVFMGDTGSLALGGILGIIAVLIHQPFLLVIAGGVFVMEAVSVMLQTSWFRWTRRRTGTGRRLFLMAPIHHHFEKKGWYESQVVARFYILCVVCAVVALSSLKIR
jgi:phospho-N-acetylmuramoyl-pentapeptide-transferase